MASYLTMLEQLQRYQSYKTPLNFLVSGVDTVVRNRILYDICQKVYAKGNHVIFIDDSVNNDISYEELQYMGYQVVNGFQGYRFSEFFQMNNFHSLSRLREFLSCFDYSEQEKQKCVAYLNFINHLEKISDDYWSGTLDVITLGKYSSVGLVGQRLEQLYEDGKINRQEKEYLMAKYSEVCSAGADLENLLYLIQPFQCGKKQLFKDCKSAYVFSFQQFGTDQVMKKLVMLMIKNTLEDVKGFGGEIIVVDEGRGGHDYLTESLGNFYKKYPIHLFSEDIFLLDDHLTDKLFSYFNVRVYSRHTTMKSCESISKALGEVQVRKDSYSESYDRRWKSNSLLDILFQNNKTEVYSVATYEWEPRYEKERIHRLLAGEGIIEYMGNSSLFSIS